MLSAVIVANDILKLAKSEKIDVSPMKLQKLIYFVYGQYYAETELPIFAESFEAWQHGPVVSSVYHEFKQYGSSPITNYAMDAKGSVWFSRVCSANTHYHYVLTKVWEKLKNISAVDLSIMTHIAGSPWANTFCNSIIDSSEIRDYFKEHPVYE